MSPTISLSKYEGKNMNNNNKLYSCTFVNGNPNYSLSYDLKHAVSELERVSASGYERISEIRISKMTIEEAVEDVCGYNWREDDKEDIIDELKAACWPDCAADVFKYVYDNYNN